MFLDQEAEYENTIMLMRKMMDNSNVMPLWYQVPIYMTNTACYEEDMLYAWGEGEKWIREKENISIKSINEKYPKRFYKFFYFLKTNLYQFYKFLIYYYY